MHLASTLNPLSKSEGNVPVALFIFEDQRKFLRISEDYKDTIYAVGLAFKIKKDDMRSISLSTSSLDICKGKDVLIDGDAYPVMWNVLDEINVKVGGSLVKTAESEKPTPPGTLDDISYVPISMLTSGPSQPQPRIDIERPSIRTPQTQNGPVDNTTVGESTGTRNLPPTVKGKEKASHPELLEVPTLLPHRKPNAVQPVTKGPSEDPENSGWNFSFDASTLDINPAPTSSKNVNQPEISALRRDLFPKAKKEKMDKSSSNSSDESPVKRTPTAHRSPSKEQLEPVPPIQPITGDADPRFEITIIGPEPDQSACFKTRGKHPVRKVLQAACRTFEVDYNLSHLMLAVSVEDEDRSLIHRFECAVDDTVTMCGIDPESKLYIRVDEPAE